MNSANQARSKYMKDRWAKRGLPKLPAGVLVDECFREEVEKHQWSVHTTGYAVGARMRYLHRFVWELAGRPLPSHPLTLDHINQNKLDNRLENLRVATQSLQSRNSARKGRDLPRGVRVVKRPRPYLAEICVDGKNVYLGLFATPEEASAAYESKKNELVAIEVGKSLSLPSPEKSPCTDT